MKILTPTGFQPFDGVGQFHHNQYISIDVGEQTIRCATDHNFVYDDPKEVRGKDVRVGDIIGGHKVTDVSEHQSDMFLYSPINVANGSVFYHDDFIPSTQTFFGTGDTLIDGATLLEMQAVEPLETLESDCLRVYERPVADHHYVATVDVSKGIGGDYSTFSIIDMSVRPFRLVATYRNNKISPILFPNVIYKYVKLYNDAYVIVENNDQGGIVCNGLYHDLEYEEIHMESAVKSNGIGISMNKKVKRLGCSAIKDLLETRKLHVMDKQMIVEVSTFVAKGQSYEASDGNHDDLMMNLVLFGYFTLTDEFYNRTDIDLKKVLFDNKMRAIEEDVPPFGHIDTGVEDIEEIEWSENDPWAVSSKWAI